MKKMELGYFDEKEQAFDFPLPLTCIVATVRLLLSYNLIMAYILH